MGTDIHAAIEYRDEEGWHALLLPNKYFGRFDGETEITARLDIGRDYNLFAILGDVRNGHGFGGIKTGDGFEPMSSQRGLPEDVSKDGREATSEAHSATWVSLEEILTYDWRRTSIHYGVVNAVQFEEWDRMKKWSPQPPGWCGDITGPSVVHVSESAMRDHTERARKKESRPMDLNPNWYTRISWTLSYAVSGKQIWTAILPHMLALGVRYGMPNVRLVMDFDS